jgi:hypothetical protein
MPITRTQWTTGWPRVVGAGLLLALFASCSAIWSEPRSCKFTIVDEGGNGGKRVIIHVFPVTEEDGETLKKRLADGGAAELKKTRSFPKEDVHRIRGTKIPVTVADLKETDKFIAIFARFAYPEGVKLETTSKCLLWLPVEDCDPRTVVVKDFTLSLKPLPKRP